MLAHETLQRLTSLAAFQPTGETVGNLTIGRGNWKGVAMHVALVENRIASGSLGVKECDKLASLFKVVAMQKMPLLVYLDSAGARVSEGLPALGAFRRVYAAALRGVDAGVTFVAVCGANCFGGASMLASLASVRYFSATRASPCRARRYWRKVQACRCSTICFSRCRKRRSAVRRGQNWHRIISQRMQWLRWYFRIGHLI